MEIFRDLCLKVTIQPEGTASIALDGVSQKLVFGPALNGPNPNQEVDGGGCDVTSGGVVR